MIDVNETYVWQARLAAWRGEWSFVEEYVKASITERLQEELDLRLPLPRLNTVTGVYTSYGIEFKDLEYLKSVWLEAIAFATKHAPERIDDMRVYWLESAFRYYQIEKQMVLNPADFGFTK